MARFTGTADDDRFDGGNRADWAYGREGNDHLYGGAGGDILYGEAGNDRLVGGRGIDRLYSGAGRDSVSGGAGGDYLIIESTRVHARGGGGNDYIRANPRSGLIDGGHGYDHLLLGLEAALGRGFAADLTALTTTGSATLGALEVRGVERLTLTLSRGNDQVILGDPANETDAYLVVHAGRGDDEVVGGEGNLIANGDAGDDVLHGNGGIDHLSGSDGADRLFGGIGADVLFGGNGEDRLSGERGADLLAGLAGIDMMTGGEGADLFWFYAGDTGASVATADHIADFEAAEGDQIGLSSIDADRGTRGDDAFRFIGTAAFSGEAGELRYTVVGAERHVEGDTNGDGAADFVIRLSGTDPLAAEAFVL